MGSSKKRKIITICSSASFFRHAFEIERQLKARGFGVKMPHTSLKMRRSGNFLVETYKSWLKNPRSYLRKSWLIRNHFRKILSGNAILVVNDEKNGMTGYIGGNTLMEMALAYHYKKPIYILNPVSPKLGFLEEVLGLQPVFLNGKLEKIV